jgi:hypothetical protein
MRKMTLAALAALLALGPALAGSVQSGPQVGQKIPGPFRPLNLTGPEAGQYSCLYCKYGPRPVVMVLAREITPAVARLLAKVDAATAANSDARLGSFAVFLGDPARLSDPVKQLGKSHNLSACVLAVAPAAPDSYAVAPDAAVTVVLYRQAKTKANHAFRAGELDDKAIDAILADLHKMLSEK